MPSASEVKVMGSSAQVGSGSGVQAAMPMIRVVMRNTPRF
jgi:hypothetical protein